MVRITYRNYENRVLLDVFSRFDFKILYEISLYHHLKITSFSTVSLLNIKLVKGKAPGKAYTKGLNQYFYYGSDIQTPLPNRRLATLSSDILLFFFYSTSFTRDYRYFCSKLRCVKFRHFALKV